MIGKEARKKELYEMLEKITLDAFVDQESIVDLMGMYPPREPHQTFHNSTARRMLTRDIKEINEDPAYERIVISSSGKKGVKLATREEALAFIVKNKMPCFRKLKRIAVLEDKLIRTGQINIEGEVYGL